MFDLVKLANDRRDRYRVLSHENLKITAEMKTPVASVLPWISLDSILAYAVLADLVGPDIQNLLGVPAHNMIDIPIPIEERGSEHRYYAASFGIYTAHESIEKRRKRWDDKHDDLVDFGRRKPKIQLDGLFFKSLDLPAVVRTTNVITFYVKGHSNEIERLLKKYITHVGKLRGHGWGRVSVWKIKSWPGGWSCWWNDQPMRAIPIEDEQLPGLRMEYCGYRPPYWAPQNQTLCIVPGQI
jgi:CRISPR type IV-associated protein Csf3